MFKKYMLSATLVFGLLACSANHSSPTLKVEVPPKQLDAGSDSASVVDASNYEDSMPEVVSLPFTKEFSKDNWSLTLPYTFDKLDDMPNLTFASSDSKAKIMVVWDIMDCKLSMHEYLFVGLAQLQEKGVKIVSVQHTSLSGNEAIYIVSQMEDHIMHEYSTVVNGHSYSVACLGEITNDNSVRKICRSVSDSLKFEPLPPPMQKEVVKPKKLTKKK